MVDHLGRVLAMLALMAVTAAPLRASITCEQTGGPPGEELTAHIVIESPEDGAVIEPRNACGGKVVLNGTFFVDGPPPQYDFYIVLDTSGSTDDDSGADVNRNGVLGEPADTIYQAEIQAAEDFIRALNPAASRVAIISFANTPTVRQQLTADMTAALAALAVMRPLTPGGGTYYEGALEAVRQEMLARGDLVNRIQRGVFLSDGEPTDGLPVIEAKATELARLGMVMDTFALGSIDSTALRRMAEITRGTFTALSVPGDIVALLPSFAPDVDYTFESAEALSGTPGLMVVDEVAGTFQAIVTLHPGVNQASVTLTALGVPPVSVTCSINVTMPEPLTPDAGPSVGACAGERATLDGSRSTSICLVPLYRWLDCNGTPLVPWSGTPALTIEPCALPCETVTLEMTCEGDACSKSATTIAACRAVAPPLPALASSCESRAVLTCGVTNPALDVEWDLDPATDSDGDGDPANDADATGCDVTHDFGSLGRHDVVATVSDPVAGCLAVQALAFTLVPLPAPRDVSGGTCPGTAADFSCGTAAAGTTYWWDFDAMDDADGDGDSRNDADATGCDVSHAWPASGAQEVNAWAEDSAGCRWLMAQGTFDVSPIADPGEALDLRLTRLGDSVTLTWTAVPGAFAHRVLRGPVVPLQASGVYDHGADDGAGRGACEVLGASALTDPDDVADPTAFYYLVIGVNDCGGEGPAGFGNDGNALFPRPGRTPTPGCP